MRVAELLPYLLGGGAITAIIAALRWGRQDARDTVEMAESNQTMARELRDDARADTLALKAQLLIVHTEYERMRAMVTSLGGDPGPRVDLG